MRSGTNGAPSAAHDLLSPQSGGTATPSCRPPDMSQDLAAGGMPWRPAGNGFESRTSTAKACSTGRDEYRYCRRLAIENEIYQNWTSQSPSSAIGSESGMLSSC